MIVNIFKDKLMISINISQIMLQGDKLDFKNNYTALN